jgi:hypothetical protein
MEVQWMSMKCLGISEPFAFSEIEFCSSCRRFKKAHLSFKVNEGLGAWLK